jgi:transposase InsO family protein
LRGALISASAPNQSCLTDITVFHIRAGKVYLSLIIDCLKAVISWAIGTMPVANMVRPLWNMKIL